MNTTSCPTWCTLPAGHEYDFEGFERIHSHAHHSERPKTAAVSIVAFGEAAGPGAAELLSDPAISVYLFGSPLELPAGSVGAMGITSTQARDLAAILPGLLLAAAAELDSIGAGAPDTDLRAT